MARGRGRRKDGRNVKASGPAAVTDPTIHQMSINWTPEEAFTALMTAGELQARITALKATALDCNRERRKAEGALEEILNQAAAKQRQVKVEVTEQVDMDTRTVRFLDKSGKEIGHRVMTSLEIKNGVVLNPAQANAALAAIAAEAGEQPSEGEAIGEGVPEGGPFGFNEDDPAPAGSPHPADVAQVAEAVGHEASA